MYDFQNQSVVDDNGQVMWRTKGVRVFRSPHVSTVLFRDSRGVALIALLSIFREKPLCVISKTEKGVEDYVARCLIQRL